MNDAKLYFIEALNYVCLALLFGILLAMAGCGTAVNGTVAAYEQNVAANQVQVGKNALNAKQFAVCMTPIFDLLNATPEQRAMIRAACVPAGAATDTQTTVDAMGNVTSQK